MSEQLEEIKDNVDKVGDIRKKIVKILNYLNCGDLDVEGINWGKISKITKDELAIIKKEDSLIDLYKELEKQSIYDRFWKKNPKELGDNEELIITEKEYYLLKDNTKFSNFRFGSFICKEVTHYYVRKANEEELAEQRIERLVAKGIENKEEVGLTEEEYAILKKNSDLYEMVKSKAEISFPFQGKIYLVPKEDGVLVAPMESVLEKINKTESRPVLVKNDEEDYKTATTKAVEINVVLNNTTKKVKITKNIVSESSTKTVDKPSLNKTTVFTEEEKQLIRNLETVDMRQSNTNKTDNSNQKLGFVSNDESTSDFDEYELVLSSDEEVKEFKKNINYYTFPFGKPAVIINKKNYKNIFEEKNSLAPRFYVAVKKCNENNEEFFVIYEKIKNIDNNDRYSFNKKRLPSGEIIFEKKLKLHVGPEDKKYNESLFKNEQNIIKIIMNEKKKGDNLLDNIIDIVSIEEDSICYEYLNADYITLESYSRDFSLEEKIILFEKVVKAVNQLNGIHIYHRDLHRDNIKINKKTGKIKIIDFDSSHYAEVLLDNNVALRGCVAGGSMSPVPFTKEHGNYKIGDVISSIKRDLFALGNILSKLIHDIECPYSLYKSFADPKDMRFIFEPSGGIKEIDKVIIESEKNGSIKRAAEKILINANSFVNEELTYIISKLRSGDLDESYVNTTELLIDINKYKLKAKVDSFVNDIKSEKSFNNQEIKKAITGLNNFNKRYSEQIEETGGTEEKLDKIIEEYNKSLVRMKDLFDMKKVQKNLGSIDNEEKITTTKNNLDLFVSGLNNCINLEENEHRDPYLMGLSLYILLTGKKSPFGTNGLKSAFIKQALNAKTKFKGSEIIPLTESKFDGIFKGFTPKLITKINNFVLYLISCKENENFDDVNEISMKLKELLDEVNVEEGNINVDKSKKLEIDDDNLNSQVVSISGFESIDAKITTVTELNNAFQKELLNKYCIKPNAINGGGLSRLYECSSNTNSENYEKLKNKNLVVKIINYKVAEKDSKGAIHEGLLMQALKDSGIKNIPTVYEVITKKANINGKEKYRTAIIMKKIEGENLLNYGKRGKDKYKQLEKWDLKEEDVINIAYKLSDTLNTLNTGVEIEEEKRSVVHRDLKLENVIWDGEELVLTDFGTASTGANIDKLIIGSPSYMAPEVLELKENIGDKNKTEVYALGVLLYTLLTKRPPKTDFIVDKENDVTFFESLAKGTFPSKESINKIKNIEILPITQEKFPFLKLYRFRDKGLLKKFNKIIMKMLNADEEGNPFVDGKGGYINSRPTMSDVKEEFYNLLEEAKENKLVAV